MNKNDPRPRPEADQEHGSSFPTDHHAICDACEFQITGIRYKCLNCKDFDLCQACEEAWFQKKLHSDSHVMMKLYHPLPPPERRPELCFPSLYSAPHGNVVLHRGVFCDGCDNPIIGTRYICLNCADTDLCETCEAANEASGLKHDPNHTFLKAPVVFRSALTDSWQIRYALPPKYERPNTLLPLLYPQLVRRNVRAPDPLQAAPPPCTRSASPSGVVRPMQPSDLSGVLQIERTSFDEPYDASFFSKALSKGRIRIIVVETPNGLGAYAAFWMDSSVGEARVVSLAVSPAFRRQGHGDALLQYIITRSRETHLRKVSLHVSVLNFAAQALYKKYGFRTQKWLPDYYSKPVGERMGEDGLLMEASLD